VDFMEGITNLKGKEESPHALSSSNVTKGIYKTYAATI